MNKYFYTLLTTLMAVMTTMILVSCSDDDDNVDSGTASKDQSYLKCPDEHHPHMIDLGLPSGTKWACCNVGADKPEAYGGYYAWGETEEKTVYNDITYQYCTGEDTDGDGLYDKNCNYKNLGDDIASTHYDVAHVKWRGSWRMPSQSQFTEIIKNCTFTWTTKNGVNGYQYTGPNGGAIFLPATGFKWGDQLIEAGNTGSYWSSTQSQSDLQFAYFLTILKNGGGWIGARRRCGVAVRPVITIH